MRIIQDQANGTSSISNGEVDVLMIQLLTEALVIVGMKIMMLNVAVLGILIQILQFLIFIVIVCRKILNEN